VKLNLGCGKVLKNGWVNVDIRQFLPEVEVVDLNQPWPWENGTVKAVYCSHMIEHLTASERVHFVNELYRVMSRGAECKLIAPHWSSYRAYGDMTHQWPPVSEFWFQYLLKEWRDMNAPHSDYNDEVNFMTSWVFSVHDFVISQTPENQEFARTFYKDAIQDIHATLVKK
jgi:hypothetical protein